jgi:hypothetical protein
MNGAGAEQAGSILGSYFHSSTTALISEII